MESLKDDHNLRIGLALKAGNMAWWEMDIITGAVSFGKQKAEMLGYPQEQFSHYTDFTNLVHPDDFENTMNAMRDHISGSVDLYETEYRILTKSGEYKWFYDRGSIVTRDIKGLPLTITGFVFNITDRKKAETEFQNQEFRLKTLVQAIPDLIWLKDTFGVYLSCNAMFERFFGAIEADIIGKTDYDFVDRGLADSFRENDRNAMALGRPTSNEEWVSFADDGHRAFLETVKAPMYDSWGTLTGVLGIGRDMTKRRQVEIALMESEEKFRSVYDTSNDAIMLLNKKGYFDCNPRTLELFGLNSKQEFIGLHPSAFSPPVQSDGRDSFKLANEKILTAYLTGLNSFDWIHRNSSGVDFPVKVLLSTFNFAGEKVIQATIRDVTKVEQELIAANKLLAFQNQEKEKRAEELIIANKELAFQNREKEKRADELIIANKELAYQNLEKEKRAEELSIANKKLAFQNAEKEKRAKELIIANKELAFQNREKEKRADELGIANKELAFQNREKEKRADELIVANKELAFQNAEKEIRADELIIADKNLVFQNREKGKRAAELIIANKELDYQNEEKEKRAAELVIANKELVIQNEEKEKQKAENKELEAFSYSVSHDLRAPLRHIGGFVDLLVKNNSSQLDEKGLRYLNIISESYCEMGNLIDALLTFSRLSRTELQRTKINSKTMVFQVFDTFSDEMHGRDVEINVSELPDVRGDETLINQVWVNLISNALKYSRNKEKSIIEIGGKMEKDKTVFHIRDNGAGFDMKYADKLFGVFQRLHKARDFEGIGIGLANVNRIIVRHGGECWAESEVDNGATFFFSIPN